VNDPSSEWLRHATEQCRADHAAGNLPPDIDVTVPSIARIYDYALGGKDNFEVDRRALEQIMREHGESVVRLAHINRAFLQRGVRFLADAGIRQFLDVGSGLPTARNVHDIAHEVDPHAHVVYVDRDPIVLAHGRALLADDTTTTVIKADVRDPDSILDHPETRRLIDFERPWALVMCLLLHHLTDEENPVGVARRFTERMVSGSYLLTCNALSDDHEESAKLESSSQRYAATGYFRPWSVQRQYFEGLDLVDPGLVYAADWRPDETTKDRDNPWLTVLAGGAGRKP
jgi:hypothetical protein